MRSVLRITGLAVLLAFLLPVLHADDAKKDKPAPKSDEKKADEPKKDDKKKSDDDEPKKNDKKSALKAKAAKERVKPVVIRAKMGRLDSAPKFGIIVPEPYVNGNKIETRDKEHEFEALEDLKVRTNVLPTKFDDKGRAKRYTKKELDELKGSDRTLPGYAADTDSLKPGQVVEVYLVKKKTARPNDPLTSSMQISMIVILVDAANQ